MNVEAIAAVLADAGLAEPGKTLFVHMMPAEVTEGVLLKQPLTGVEIDHYLPGYYKTTFQVIVRSRTHAAGKAKADAVMAALTTHGSTWGNMNIKLSLPATLPIVYPRSDGNAIEWSLNFMLTYTMA